MPFRAPGYQPPSFLQPQTYGAIEQIPQTLDDIINRYRQAKVQGQEKQRQGFSTQLSLAQAGVDPSSYNPEDPSTFAPIFAQVLESVKRKRGLEERSIEADIEKKRAEAGKPAVTEAERARTSAQRDRALDIQERRVAQNRPGAGKMLPPASILNINEGKNVANLLDGLDAIVDKNAWLFGPVVGRAGQVNPYATEAQSVDSQFRAVSQMIGKFMEGGVLRKEDEEKYRKMLPQLRDTPAVAKRKLVIVKDLLRNKLISDKAALSSSGYDVSGIDVETNAGTKTPEQRHQELTSQGLTDDQADDQLLSEGY